MMPVGEAVLRVPTGLPVGEIDDLNLAVSVFWPESGEIAPRLFYCLPGGGMRRAYFDLGADPRLSFARQMAARGHVCLLVDHPGVGDSDRPQDGHLLTPDLVARLHARVLEQLLDRLGAGRIDPACPTIEYPRAVAVGHSMGAMIAVWQQARWQQFEALALLGFGTDGLPVFLPPAARELMPDSAALRAALPELARQMFPAPYPQVGGAGDGGQLFGSKQAEPAAVAALNAVRDGLLPQPAMLSMVPDNVAPEAAKITVPILLVLGERDLVAAPVESAAIYPESPEVQVLDLPATGHSHFLFASRDRLFEGLSDWANKLTTMGVEA